MCQELLHEALLNFPILFSGNTLAQQTDDEEQPKDISAIWNLKWMQGEKERKKWEMTGKPASNVSIPVGDDVYLWKMQAVTPESMTSPHNTK